MAAAAESNRKDGVEALVEQARRIHQHRSGGTAVEIRLGNFRGKVPQGNLLFAINMFRSLVDQNEGRLFILDNSDLFFIYRGLRLHDVRSAVTKLRLLYSEELLRADETRTGRPFCTWFDLATDSARFLAVAESLLEEETRPPPAARRLAAVREAQPAADPDQPQPPSSELERLSRAALAIDRIKIGPLVRRQAVWRLEAGAPPAREFQEIYISIPDLEKIVIPDGRLTADRWLFQYFTQLLDRRMLLFLRDTEDRELASDLSINLNLSSLLAPEFGMFSDALPEAARRSIVIEFQKVDVFSDLGTYLYVRDMARERGFRICLDGVTDLSLPFIEPRRLGLDLTKLRWRPDILRDDPDGCRAALAPWAAGAEAGRLVLCRTDSQEAVDFGHALGVRLFQGRHLDALAQSRP